jgi:hypothetical protein
VQYRAKNNILIGITLLCMVTIVAFGYLMEEEPISGQSPIAQTYTMDERKINELPKTDLEEMRIEQIYPCVDQNIAKEEAPENTQAVAEPSVDENTTSASLTKSIKISHQGDAEAPTTQKPKLVIIIDDVTTPKELHAIEALGMKITPSISHPLSDR